MCGGAERTFEIIIHEPLIWMELKQLLERVII